MNVTPAFLDSETGMTTFNVERLTYTHGSDNPTKVTTSGVLGSIHPGSLEELQLLPEEERSEEFIKIHSEFAFSLGKDNGTTYTAPDRVIWNSNTWRVVRTKDWASMGFHIAYAVLMREVVST